MKMLVAAVTAVLLLVVMAVCAGGMNGDITVISREDGSGTRGAFIELLGIEFKGADGSRKDLTTKEAIVGDKTDIVMTNIANDPSAIGYISIGSLNGTVRALEIDGVRASEENVKNGTYKIRRPFNIAVKGELTAPTKDFIAFILSKEGQAVVAANKYIPVDADAASYSGNRPSGKVVVAGSSSVAPVMEKLREAYLTVNLNAVIEIQMNDSTAGMTAVRNGSCDIGMASRALKGNELAELTGISIAIDGIAIVVNNRNQIVGLTYEQAKGIFMGKITNWDNII